MPQIKLVSNDGVSFTVDSEIVTKCMKTIQNLFDGLGKFDPEEEITIPVANGEILRTIIDWVIHHKGDPPFYEEVRDIREWDQNFLKVIFCLLTSKLRIPIKCRNIWLYLNFIENLYTC